MTSCPIFVASIISWVIIKMNKHQHDKNEGFLTYTAIHHQGAILAVSGVKGGFQESYFACVEVSTTGEVSLKR